MGHPYTVPPASLGSGSVPNRYSKPFEACVTCSGLGFITIVVAADGPTFEEIGLTRHEHPNGKITWEGDCQACKGTGNKHFVQA